jgi:RNA recognition motif-containing protein
VFDSEESIQRAVDEMNGKDVNEQRVRVEVAGQPKKPKGPQPEDECRLCGRKGHWYRCIYAQEERLPRPAQR